jgi:ubiquinone/menaquinone biosynthesis C-methylase UbiE
MRERQEQDGKDYVLPREDEEYQRLEMQARMLEEPTRRILAKAGVRSGQRCLDIGCGTGSVMRILGEMVGPSGSVLGVDLDKRIGALALSALEAEQPGRHRFEPVDLTTAESISGAPFDVVFARLVVFHMPDQVAALARFWSWVAPGGVLVIIDFDLTHLKSYPTNEVIERATEFITTTFSRAGRDAAIGAHVPLLLAEAGVGRPDGIDVSGVMAPVDFMLGQIRPLVRSLTPAAIALEIADGATLEALDRDLAAQVDAAAFARGPDTIGVWKRKPS